MNELHIVSSRMPDMNSHVATFCLRLLPLLRTNVCMRISTITAPLSSMPTNGTILLGTLGLQETDINDIIKAESEVKLRDEQRRDTEATFKKYDTDGNGRLEPGEIARALKDLGLRLPLTQMDEYVHNVMHIYDDNNDGFLRIHEFEKLYSVCMATEAVRGRYVEKVLDIASDENQIRSLAQHAFDKFDTDNSGSLEIAELAEVLLHMLPLKHVRGHILMWNITTTTLVLLVVVLYRRQERFP